MQRRLKTNRPESLWLEARWLALRWQQELLRVTPSRTARHASLCDCRSNSLYRLFTVVCVCVRQCILPDICISFTQPPMRLYRICFTDVFFCFLFFLFFFRSPKIWDNRSQERLNGFPWNFYQTIPGKVEFATSCRRLANDSELVYAGLCWLGIVRPRRLRYKIMSARMHLI